MNAQQVFQQVSDYINECVFERSQEILYMLAAVISAQHVFLIGPPGTGKSMMINRMLRCFSDDVEYFDILMMAETSKTEVFGMPDIKALKGGKYKFAYEKMLPTAHFAFLDEIWKANSGVLNSLLTAINERKFKNGTEMVETPLRSLFTASNELPQDDSLQALYDRMVFRMECPPLLKESSKLKLIDRQDGADVEPDAPEVLTLELIDKARAGAKAVKFDEVARGKWIELQHELKVKMAGTCYVSDRRWAMAYNALKAVVWLNGGDTITKDDFIFLGDMLWEDPKQRAAINSMLVEYLSTVTKAGYAEYNRIHELYEELQAGSIDLPTMYDAAKKSKQKFEELRAEGDSPVLESYEQKFNLLFIEIRDRFMEEMGL